MIKNSLGGSLFIRDGIKYDYCYIPALKSLMVLCDKVVVMDCSSTDGTENALKKFYIDCSEEDRKKLLIVYNAQWEVGHKYFRLSILANRVRTYLSTDYHFSLQADEVLHENSFQTIREAINSGKGDTYMCRRFNLYHNFDSYIKDDSAYQPCSNYVIRLGKTHVPAVSDAESLRADDCIVDRKKEINIFHYGFVRKDKEFLDKVIDMQTWFFDKGYVDKRVIAMKEKDNKFISTDIIPLSEVASLPMTHPRFVLDWINERRLLNK